MPEHTATMIKPPAEQLLDEMFRRLANTYWADVDPKEVKATEREIKPGEVYADLIDTSTLDLIRTIVASIVQARQTLHLLKNPAVRPPRDEEMPPAFAKRSAHMEYENVRFSVRKHVDQLAPDDTWRVGWCFVVADNG